MVNQDRRERGAASQCGMGRGRPDEEEGFKGHRQSPALLIGVSGDPCLNLPHNFTTAQITSMCIVLSTLPFSLNCRRIDPHPKLYS